MSETRHCSFCGKPESEVALLIAGTNAYICEACIAECTAILADRHRDRYAADQRRVATTVAGESLA